MPLGDTEKVKFLDVFDEDKNETLTLRRNIRVRGEDFKIEESFRKGEKIAGVDFHLLRYFDIALKSLEGDIYEITGIFPKN